MKVTKDYETKLSTFIKELSLQLSKRNKELGSVNDVAVTFERGYKFDKIIIDGKEVRFMIELKTQTIFGCKSAQQINKNWNFGTLEQIAKWNWGGYHPEPLDKSIETVSKHGPYKKYKMKDNA